MPDATTVNIAIKATTDTSGIASTGNAISQLEKGINHAGSEWERFGRQLEKKFSIPDLGKGLLLSFGVGSAFAVVQSGINFIADKFAEAKKDAAEVSAFADELVQKARKLHDVKLEAFLQDKTPAEQISKLNRELDLLLPRLAAARAIQQETAADTAAIKGSIALSGTAMDPLAGKYGYGHTMATVGEMIDARRAKAEKAEEEALDRQLAIGAKLVAARKNLVALTEKQGVARLQGDPAQVKITIIEDFLKASAEESAALDKSAEAWRAQISPLAAYQQKEREVQVLVARGKLTQDEATAALKRLKNELDDVAGKAIRAAREEVEKYDLALSVLDKNPALTDSEKYAQRIALLHAQAAAIERVVAALDEFQKKNPGVDVGGITSAIESFNAKKAQAAGSAQPAQTLAQRDAGALRDLGDPAKHYQTAGAGAQGGLIAQIVQIGTAGDMAARAMQTAFSGAAAGIQQGLTGIFARTMSLGQGLRSIWNGFAVAASQAFTQMIAEYAVKKAAMFALDTLFAAKGLALSLANAAKSLVAWIPSAIAASISSWGLAAAIGAAAVLALTAREAGGPVTAGRAYLVGEKRPEVFVPHTDGFILPDAASVMTRPGYQPAAASPAGGGASATLPQRTAFVDYRDHNTLEHLERDPRYQTHFVHMMQKHRRTLGGNI